MSGIRASLKKKLKQAGFNRYNFKGQNKSLSSVSTTDLILFATAKGVL